MNNLTLKKLYKTKFRDLYVKLLKNSSLSTLELEQILSVALYLLSVERDELNFLGYRMFLLYSKKTSDYKPLYEISLNLGYIPVAQYIYKDLGYSERFANLHTEINDITNNKFKRNNTYQTIGQHKLFNDAENKIEESQIIVAPTSYGKTELMLSIINNVNFKKICILTPTKSLLAQTKKRIIDNMSFKKIITYPEMYKNNDNQFLAILTQERLLRLLQKNHDLKFDLLIVDEAHNLLEKGSKEETRSLLLASAIFLCNKRNPNIICKYLTPCVYNAKNLTISHLSTDFQYYKVNENIKSEMFYFYNLKEHKQYIIDQYAPNKHLVDYKIFNFFDDSEVIINNNGCKKIVYLNKPKDVEKIADEIYQKLPVLHNKKLKHAANCLRNYVHKDYKLAKYIEKGIVFHHGSISESVRIYIEYLYCETQATLSRIK